MQGAIDIFAIIFKPKVKCDMNSESHFDLWYDDVLFSRPQLCDGLH